jgi:branched-chain amino acid transport system substrate-binding protein
VKATILESTLRASVEAAQALVRGDGSVAELTGSAGPQLLEHSPDLRRYAMALIATDVPRVEFVYIPERRRWLLVRISLVPDRGGSAAALVEIDHRCEAPFALTLREFDVLTLLAGGLSNPEIGGCLYTSRRTISTHVERLLEKLGKHSRTAIASLAVDHGLMRLPLPARPELLSHLAVGVVALSAGQDSRLPNAPAPTVRERTRLRPILLGLALPEGSADATEMLNGSTLAIEEINDHGGVAGRPIERVTVEVDIGDAEAIRGGLRDLVEVEVDAAGLSYSYVEDPVFYREISEYGCPVVNVMTSEAQARWVREDPDSYGRIFQMGPTESSYGVAFYQFLERLSAEGRWQPSNRRVVCVETTVSAGHVLDTPALREAERLGWEVESIITVANRDVDWQATLGCVRKSSPAAILLVHFVPQELAEFQRRFVADPTDSLVHCVYAPSVPEYRKRAGLASEGVTWSTCTGTYGDLFGRSFSSRYELRFGSRPGRAQAGLFYDQVHLLAGAWARHGNVRAFADVADHLRRSVHRGVNGVYALGAPGQTGLAYPYSTLDLSIAQAHLFFQIQDSEDHIISPQPYLESNFVLPSWFGLD